MKTDFYKKHSIFLAALDENGSIDIRKNIFLKNYDNFPQPEQIKISFKSGLVDYYEQIQAINLVWELSPEHRLLDFLDAEIDFVEGEFNLINEKDFFSGLDENHLQKEYGQIIENDLKGKLYPFEILKDEFIICANKSNQDQLIFLDLSSGRNFRLPISFRNYIEAGYYHYFFYGWQKAIFLNSQPEIKRLRHYLPQLFPNYSF